MERKDLIGLLAVIIGVAYVVYREGRSLGGIAGDPVLGTYLIHAALSVAAVASVLWLWLAIRPWWATDKPRHPRGTILASGWGPQHRPDDRPAAPWWYVCELIPKKTFSPAIFRVTVSEQAQRIRGTIWQHDKAFPQPGQSAREALLNAAKQSGEQEKDPQHVTLNFYVTPLTPRDKLTIVAESTSPDLRIVSVKYKPRRGRGPKP